MKPRLADAPNGIVGGKKRPPASSGAGGGSKDLLSGAASESSSSHHSAATVPISMLSAASSDLKSPGRDVSPSPMMVHHSSASSPSYPSSTSGSMHGAQHSSSSPAPSRPAPPVINRPAPEAYSPMGKMGGNESSRRRAMSDSQEKMPVIEKSPVLSGNDSKRRTTMIPTASSSSSFKKQDTGPLQIDTRQQELLEKAHQQHKSGGLFPSLRGRTPKPARKLEDPFAKPEEVSASASVSIGGNSSTGGASESSNSSADMKKKRGSLIFNRGSSRSEDKKMTPPPPLEPKEPSRHDLRRDGKNSERTSDRGGGGSDGSDRGSSNKKTGFFAKLKTLAGGKKHTESPGMPTSTTPRKRRSFLAAHDLEFREAQLQAAGFSQLPGTLLSRAKGDKVDSKYLLKWKQFDMIREIGEGAYAMVYLAEVALADGSKKEVALKELKLQGNEESEDIRLEVEAVADAIADCGFVEVAEVLRVGSQLMVRPETYESAKKLLMEGLSEFRRHADPQDEACVMIVNVFENLVALPAPVTKPEETSVAESKGAPQRLLEDVMREVEVLSKLWHKNIVEFVGTCVDLPHLAIAMQYCHKGPLSELLINEDVVMGWDLRIKWAKETAEAINYLHNLDPKIIHRDLKADNILIDKSDTAFVTDFGLSKAKVLTMMNPTGAPTLAGRSMVGGSRAKYRSFVEFSEVAGTPSYLAPELWRNESYTEMVDVYSFGLVLWELVARDAPYRDLDNEDLVIALRDQHLRPEIPKWTPEPYKLLMERCWSELPSTRPNFDQIVKLLKMLQEKHVFQWDPPANYSLNEEVQKQHVIDWEKGKQEKEIAMSLAEKKLLAAREQLKNMKGTSTTTSGSSVSSAGDLASPKAANTSVTSLANRRQTVQVSPRIN